MDLYGILGVVRGAKAAEIRRAYQKRARRLHPDLNPGDPVAAEHFREIARAFEVLSDSLRRAEYDRTGGLAAEPEAGVPDVGFAGFDFSVRSEGEGSFGFREFLDSALPDGADEQAGPGEDLEHSTRLTFDESLEGAERRLHVMRQERCRTCEGRGELAREPLACPKCDGAGQVKASRGHMIFTRRCKVCRGSGRLHGRPCGSCQAEGRVMQSEWLDVRVPPGVQDGSRVRLEHLGNAGRRGGPFGALVLKVEVEPHPFFRREGADLHCTVPVTIFEAALGGHVEVPTPGGRVAIEIPAGTQSDARFRLRKRGVPRLGGSSRGDLYVEVKVTVPKIDDPTSRELLRDLARRHAEDPRAELWIGTQAEPKP